MDAAESKAILESHLSLQDWIEKLVDRKTDEQLTPQEKHGLRVAGRLVRDLAESCHRTRSIGSKFVEIFESMDLKEPPTPPPSRLKCEIVERPGFLDLFKFWKWFR